MKELIEVTTAVIRKRLSVYEPAFAIESQRRIEGGAAPGLKADPAHAAPVRYRQSMCSRSAAAIPLRRCLGSVRIDFNSPVPSPSSFKAAIPANSGPSHADQTVTFGACRPERSSANTCPGGEFWAFPQGVAPGEFALLLTGQIVHTYLEQLPAYRNLTARWVVKVTSDAMGPFQRL